MRTLPWLLPWLSLRWLAGTPQRAVRVLRAFAPALAKPDDGWAKRVLSPAEYALYARMDRRDRHHACLVAARLLARYPAPSSELLRAALLHDVGKSAAPYRALERVAVHLYLPLEPPPEPPLPGLRGAWQRARHHDRYGAAMILRAGGSRRVAELVARHHRPEGDQEAQALKEIDEAL